MCSYYDNKNQWCLPCELDLIIKNKKKGEKFGGTCKKRKLNIKL